MLTTKEFAAELGIKYPTVMGWIREGRVPEAKYDDSHPRGGIWLIPQSALARFKNPESRPQRGRPSKKGQSK